MYEDDKSDTSGELTSDVTEYLSRNNSECSSQDEGGSNRGSSSPNNSECSSQDEGGSNRGSSPVVRKASKIYYVVGTPITQPKSDPSDEHVRWFTEAYNSEEVLKESYKFDIFQAVLDQCEIPNVCASDLSEFMIDFITKQRDIVEPVINNNLKARSLKFETYVKLMEKGKTNGLDVTLKCISMMLRKAIVVLCEDYLWLTHRRDLKDIELVMILREDGKFRGLRRSDGRLLKCNLPYLKEWMQSESNQIDDDAENNSEKTDPMETSHCDIDNSPENTDNIHRSEGDIENGAENTDIVEKNVQEIRGHLDVKDIQSSDSEVLVPSSNAAIAGLTSIPYNTSDTTFDDSVATVNTYNKSVDNITSDHSYINSVEVTDGVVQNPSAVNIVLENNSNKIDEKEKSEVTDRVVQSASAENIVMENNSNKVDEKQNSEVTDLVVQSASAENIVLENNSNTFDEKQKSEVTGENISRLKPDVTQSESTMEFSTHSMDTEKSSYKESDAVTSESRDSNISLQYLTDEGKN